MSTQQPKQARKLKHLSLSYMDAYDADVKGHAQAVMKDLGITYLHSTPQSISDSFLFWCCDNLPDKLPHYLQEISFHPEKYIGYGLSANMAEEIERKSIVNN